MTTNRHHRHFTAGTAALAAAESATVQSVTRRRPRRGAWPPYGRPAVTKPLPPNVVELYPGAAQPRSRRRAIRLMGSETGMATAEYAIATLAAVGFAGLLVFILRSDEVSGFLLTLIRTALALP
jgi:hypothetical protein